MINFFKGEFYQKTEKMPITKEYFDKNWKPVEDKWVMFYRYGLPTDKNETNNNVEPINGKLKQFVRKSSTMHNCLQGILKYINHLDRTAAFRNYWAR